MTAGRRVKPATMIDRAIAVVRDFNPATQTVDSYADDALLGGNSKTSDSSIAATSNKPDFVFLKQV